MKKRIQMPATTTPKSRRSSGYFIVLSICCATFLGLSARAQTVIVESRTSGGATTANPPYLEGGAGANWGNSTSKSTAAGGLVGSGSRFATAGTPFFTVTPTLTSGATYAVQVTLTPTSASADIVVAVATT